MRRSTPFRLAVAFAALLIGSFLLAGVVVFQVMNGELKDRVDEDLQKTFALLSSEYDQNDIEDMVAAVQRHSDLSAEGEQLFGLDDPSGRRLAGNLVLPRDSPPSGMFNLTAGALGQKESNGTYRVIAGPVGPNTMAIAYSFGETDELRMIVLSGLAWATLIAAALAVSGGALIAARVQRRLDAIGATMDDVSRGRLASRIPLIGRHDDIDVMSSQINAALDRIAALMEGLRQIGYDIAHDLRTPLNRVRLTIEGALAKAGTGDLAADLEEATAEIDRATQTFDALLRIAQIEAGARRSRFVPVNLATIIADVHDAYAEVAIDAGKSLDIDAKPVASLQGDRELLTQLVANLVENGLTHTPIGTHIILSCAMIDGQAVMKVADNGPGIPADEREQVFRRLYRMDKSRSTPGSGLGLSMAKAIAELHGASVALGDAAPGVIVIVRFPAV